MTSASGTGYSRRASIAAAKRIASVPQQGTDPAQRAEIVVARDPEDARGLLERLLDRRFDDVRHRLAALRPAHPPLGVAAARRLEALGHEQALDARVVERGEHTGKAGGGAA